MLFIKYKTVDLQGLSIMIALMIGCLLFDKL